MALGHLLSEDRGHILADRTRDSVCFEKIVEIIALCIPQHPLLSLLAPKEISLALCAVHHTSLPPRHCP